MKLRTVYLHDLNGRIEVRDQLSQAKNEVLSEKHFLAYHGNCSGMIMHVIKTGKVKLV